MKNKLYSQKKIYQPMIALMVFVILSCSIFYATPTCAIAKATKKTITFYALDGLEITADYYLIDAKKPLIILCHQAGWSRGEYNEIAPILNRMGYNCLAIDQRSGDAVNGIANETAKRAKQKKLPTNYIDAEQDIVAAITWATKIHKEIILWGSSYSASLVLKIAQDNKNVSKVLSFSPGEYFGKDLNIQASINELKKPVFLTCAAKEIVRTQIISEAIPSKEKVVFWPTTNGNHGAHALWLRYPDSKDYWLAVTDFLDK